MSTRILIAEDDPVSRRVLEATLQKWDFEVDVAADGDEAAAVLASPDCPRLAIFDWMMPGKDGPDLCEIARQREDGQAFYILLLTAKAQKEDIVTGLSSGADDYVTKPFNREELRARLHTGQRIITLQKTLAERIGDLETALAEVKALSGLLPICSYCKRIREGDDYWQQVESYIAHHSEASFSHGVCPDCYDEHVKPALDQL